MPIASGDYENDARLADYFLDLEADRPDRSPDLLIGESPIERVPGEWPVDA